MTCFWIPYINKFLYLRRMNFGASSLSPRRLTFPYTCAYAQTHTCIYVGRRRDDRRGVHLNWKHHSNKCLILLTTGRKRLYRTTIRVEISIPRQIYPWRWQDPAQQTRPQNTHDILMPSHIECFSRFVHFDVCTWQEVETRLKVFYRNLILQDFPRPPKCRYFPISLEIK